MAAKSKAAKTGAAAFALKDSPYVERLLQDPELRQNIAQALQSSRDAYSRLADGKKPHKALLEDKRLKKDLKKAGRSFRDAGEALQDGPQRKKGGFGLGKLLLLTIVAAAVALGVSEELRKKALDALFGAEEEFEYTSPTASSTTSTQVSSGVNGDDSA